MHRFLFQKADQEIRHAKGARRPSTPITDPRLLILMSARYV